jgi:hypothetical protein
MSDLYCAECGIELAGTYSPAIYEGSNAGIPGDIELDDDTVEDNAGNLFCSQECHDDYHKTEPEDEDDDAYTD